MIADPKTSGERASEDSAEDIPADDPHKTEKLTKAGRDDFDPDDGTE